MQKKTAVLKVLGYERAAAIWFGEPRMRLIVPNACKSGEMLKAGEKGSAVLRIKATMGAKQRIAVSAEGEQRCARSTVTDGTEVGVI